MKRREFLQTVTAATAATLILPRTRLFGADAPSNKLHIALIGAYGRGRAHWDAIASENVVALCDVDSKQLAQVPGSSGPGRGGHLHAGLQPRVHFVVGDEPRAARLL